MKIEIHNRIFDVRYNYTTAIHGIKTWPNGDPGEPPIPAEIEVYSISYLHRSVRVYDLNIDRLPEWFMDRVLDEIEEAEG